jgi:hypothetical protein
MPLAHMLIYSPNYFVRSLPVVAIIKTDQSCNKWTLDFGFLKSVCSMVSPINLKAKCSPYELRGIPTMEHKKYMKAVKRLLLSSSSKVIKIGIRFNVDSS